VTRATVLVGSVLVASVLFGACGASDSGRPVGESSLDSPVREDSVSTTTRIADTAVDATIAPTVASTVDPTSAPRGEDDSVVTLHDFSEADSVVGWNVQNDTVMGGVSQSSVEWVDGTLVFAGRVSLDNNGGFASVRGPFGEATPAGADSLVLTAAGDGRTYVVQLVTGTDSYIRRFVAEPGENVYTMPFDEFEATSFMLDPVTPRGPLVSEAIGQFAIYILDKQEGEFELRLRSIALRP